VANEHEDTNEIIKARQRSTKELPNNNLTICVKYDKLNVSSKKGAHKANGRPNRSDVTASE
jgi:hypothetical protein